MSFVQQHLLSKTNGGLILLLGVVVGLAAVGRLTPEAVDAIKYLGAAFMSVRVAANVGDSFGKGKQ